MDASAITGFSLVHSTGSPIWDTQPRLRERLTRPTRVSHSGQPDHRHWRHANRRDNDAAGRTLPDFTELGAGQIGGLTLTPGLYKWSSDVLISSDVTISGSPTDVWIFQIAGKITQATGTKIFLAGGALAKNIFWQAFGDVSLGTTTHFEGIIMAQTSISLGTGASVDGRLLSQTAVTLPKPNAVSAPAAAAASTLISAAAVTGPYVDAIGQSFDSTTLTAPWSAAQTILPYPVKHRFNH